MGAPKTPTQRSPSEANASWATPSEADPTSTTAPPRRATTARASSTHRAGGHCLAGLPTTGWSATTTREGARARVAATRPAILGSASGSRGTGAGPVPPAISHPRSIS